MTTSLALVAFTTVVFGSTVGVLQQYLSTSKRPASNSSRNSKKNGLNDVTFAAAEEDGYQKMQASKRKESHVTFADDEFQKVDGAEASEVESFDLSAQESDYEEMLHPNEEKSQLASQKQRVRRYKGCFKYLHRFDELIMKPIFIYKYEKNMQKRSTDFFELFMKQGQAIEQEFKNEAAIHHHHRPHKEHLKMIHKSQVKFEAESDLDVNS